MHKHPVLKSYIIKSFYTITKNNYDKKLAKEMHYEHMKTSLDLASHYPNLPKAKQVHYYEQILPFIAAYMVMQQYDPQKTDTVLWEIIQRRSTQASNIIKPLLKVPGLYKKVPGIANALISKSFNVTAGFKYSRIECQKTLWKADIIQCPYYEACKKFECPEIAHYFCDSDDLIYGNLHKKVLWKRTKTLGRGQDVCDFHVEIE